MRILVSVKDEAEVETAVEGGAEIIDVKNPAEGSLGAAQPQVIEAAKKQAPEGVEVSATVGDFPDLPGSAALACVGAAAAGAGYVKVGLYGVSSEGDAVEFMSTVVEAMKKRFPEVKVAAAGYADYQGIGAVDYRVLPEVAAEAGCRYVMVDTAVKDGRTLFDYAPEDELRAFVSDAHGRGLKAAVGGSLSSRDLPLLLDLGVDVAGFRGALCGGRRDGVLDLKLVRELITGHMRLEI